MQKLLHSPRLFEATIGEGMSPDDLSLLAFDVVRMFGLTTRPLLIAMPAASTPAIYHLMHTHIILFIMPDSGCAGIRIWELSTEISADRFFLLIRESVRDAEAARSLAL